MQAASCGCPIPLNNHECSFWKKRWYLALSVNAFSTAARKSLPSAAVMAKSNFQGTFHSLARHCAKRIRHLLSRR